MRRSLLLFSASVILAAGIFAACKQKTAAQADPDEDAGSETTTPPNGDDDDEAGSQGTPAEPPTGIPCDVQAVIENRCAVCHGATDPKGPPLLTYDDFAAKGTADAGVTRGQLAASYMTAKTMPKAPGVATDDEIAIVNEWISGGMMKSTESCVLVDNDASAPDGGAAVDSGTDAGVCTSKVVWTTGNGELMRPGEDCVGCHAANGGAALLFAGTVYPTLHEPNDCNGAPPPITVTVTDRRNKKVALPVNAAGNFVIRADDNAVKGLRAPFKIAVSSPGKTTRTMNRTITGGSCNVCHTQAGGDGGAGPAPPGRVLAPAAP